MKYAEEYTAIKETVIAIHNQIGDRYRACYLYGSLAQGFFQADESDVNLLVIVDNDTSIHDIREAYLPVWEKYSAVLKRPPGVATRTAFQRHMALNPLLARHIDRYGKQVQGSSRTLSRTTSLDNRYQLSHIAAKAMQASAALLPELAPTDDIHLAHLALLRRIARQLQREPLSADAQPFELLLDIHQHLQKQFTLLSLDYTTEEQTTAPPYDIPHLLAVYEKMDQLIFVVDHLEDLPDAPWEEIFERTSGFYGGIQIVTPAQLMLAVEYEAPLELLLRNYRHKWGTDFLAALDPPVARALRDAARFTSQIQIFDLPQAYLQAPDDQTMRKIIHDFGNKLLNARLQNELLGRLQIVTPNQPDISLLDKDHPSPERIKAIFDHLEWWTAYYTSAMATSV